MKRTSRPKCWAGGCHFQGSPVSNESSQFSKASPLVSISCCHPKYRSNTFCEWSTCHCHATKGTCPSRQHNSRTWGPYCPGIHEFMSSPACQASTSPTPVHPMLDILATSTPVKAPIPCAHQWVQTQDAGTLPWQHTWRSKWQEGLCWYWGRQHQQCAQHSTDSAGSQPQP